MKNNKNKNNTVHGPNHGWLVKRKYTVIMFAVENSLLGMEFSLTFLTLLFYLNTLVKTSTPKLFYSLISVAFLLSNVVFSVAIGRIADKYRNTRNLFLVCNFVCMIGNLLYSLHYSPWLLLIGRIFSGVAAPLKSVISSEVVRSYPEEKANSVLAVMGMSYVFGFTIGPAVNFAFKPIDTWIGSWHITFANAPGLYMTFLFMVLEILSLYFVHDLSKEYDFKSKVTKQDTSPEYVFYFESNNIDEEKMPILQSTHQAKNAFFSDATTTYFKHVTHDPRPLFKTMKLLYSDYRSLLLLVATFLFLYFRDSFDLWIPLMIVDVLGWSVTEINYLMLCTSVTTIVFFAAYLWRPPHDKARFITAIITFIDLILMLAIFIVFKVNHDIFVVNIILWAVWCFCFSTLAVTTEVFFVGTLAKMVPSDIQTTAESIRLTLARMGSLCGLATSVPLFEYLCTTALCYIVIVLITVVLFLCQKRFFMKPRVLFVSLQAV